MRRNTRPRINVLIWFIAYGSLSKYAVDQPHPTIWTPFVAPSARKHVHRTKNKWTDRVFMMCVWCTRRVVPLKTFYHYYITISIFKCDLLRAHFDSIVYRRYRRGMGENVIEYLSSVRVFQIYIQRWKCSFFDMYNLKKKRISRRIKRIFYCQTFFLNLHAIKVIFLFFARNRPGTKLKENHYRQYTALLYSWAGYKAAVVGKTQKRIAVEDRVEWRVYRVTGMWEYRLRVGGAGDDRKERDKYDNN